MKVAVVSSLYGGYDNPPPPAEQTIDAEWIMVTDATDVPGWTTVHEPKGHMHPRLAAKVAKCRPDLYTDADVTVWLDASVEVTSPKLIESMVEWMGTGTIAQFRHPARISIVDEAAASEPLAKYQGQPVRQQAEHYLSQGYPDGWGLWATGLIVRRHADVTRRLGDWWLREQMRWTYQDQISEAPLLHRLRLKPVPLPAEEWCGDMWHLRTHASEH